jgi:hypothetical protein
MERKNPRPIPRLALAAMLMFAARAHDDPLRLSDAVAFVLGSRLSSVGAKIEELSHRLNRTG